MRPFFLRIVRKGKRNNNTPKELTKTMQEDKPRTTKTKPQKIGEEHKRRANTRTKARQREKTKGKHAASL